MCVGGAEEEEAEEGSFDRRCAGRMAEGSATTVRRKGSSTWLKAEVDTAEIHVQ